MVQGVRLVVQLRPRDQWLQWRHHDQEFRGDRPFQWPQLTPQVLKKWTKVDT